MGLRSKIFAAFSVVLFALLGLTQYITNSQTEAFEVERITNQLRLASDRFSVNLDNQRKSTFKLVRTITLDQKYRAFLEQIKENFFSFAEEIALDTGSDQVFMLDEDLKLRGVSPPRQRGADLEAHFEKMANLVKTPHLAKAVEDVIETGIGISRVVAFADGLANAIFVPLKESSQDDYALGVVMVADVIDDKWVRNLLGDEVDELDVVFFVGGRPVSSDTGRRSRQILVEMRSPDANTIAVETIRNDRHLAMTVRMTDAGAEAGYVVAANLDRALKPFIAIQRTVLMTGGAVLIIGLLITLGIAGRIVSPIRHLAESTKRVVDGDYSFRVENPSSDEVGQLSQAFQTMVEGLQEKEQIRNLFGKYVHPSIVSGLLEDSEQLGIGGKRQVQTLLFSDVAGFVEISSHMDAEELVTFLNRYLGGMTEELTRSDGILDKYLGDGIMAFFGPPFTPGNHAMAACRAALRMQNRLSELRAEWEADGLRPVHARIGIATGEVVVGNIGSEQAQDYTCIGETVNLASRFESVNKQYGTAIIIGAGAREMAGREVAVRELDTVIVVGSDVGMRIYELLGLAGETSGRQDELVERYEEALSHYRAGHFDQAAPEFELLTKPPFDDTASKVMAERCREFIAHPVENWHGIYELTKK